MSVSSPTRDRSWPTILLLLLASGASAQDTSPIRPAADAPQPLSPRESAACVRLPDGFKIELIASEPVVEEPSCVAFDEFGRTFVCELHGYNVEGEIDVAELNKAGQLDRQVRRIRWELKGGNIAEQAAMRQYGRLKLLIDEDSDGVMDRAEVWADDLPACYGIVPARGGMIVTCSPDIVFLADRDMDGKVDVREVLFTGFRKEVLERGINNPRWGLDNWIYVGSGGSGGAITGPHLPGNVQLGNSDFRMKPDGSAIEPVNGSVGTFGMTINEWGDRFPASGSQPATYALPLPYRFLARNPHVPTPRATHSAVDYNHGNRISEPHPWRVQRRQDPAWIKFYGDRETDSNYFSGGCSNEYYGDDLFPAKYRGSLFYCEPSLNIVHRCVIHRDGLPYHGQRAPSEEDIEFLASTDQWFRPMNLRVGPDGALYIVDMYREIIEDYSAIPRYLQQQYGLDKGREHGRIWRLSSKDAPPASFGAMAKSSAKELVREFTVTKMWRRKTAQRLLVERGDTSVVPDLELLLDSESRPDTLLHVLYTLAGLGKLEPHHLRAVLEHDDTRVRTHAIRLSHAFLDEDADLLRVIIDSATDKSPIVRAEVAMALGASNNVAATSALVRLARRHDGDSWMAAALLSSATNAAEQVLGQLLGEETLTKDTQSLLRPLAATVAGERGATGIMSPLERLVDRNESVQVEVLSGLLDGLPNDSLIESGEELSSLAALLDSRSATVRRLAMRLGLKLQLQDDSILLIRFNEFSAIARDDAIGVKKRVDAIESLGGAPFGVMHRVATHCLDARQAPETRRAAVSMLDSSQDQRVAEALLADWNSHTPEIRKLVMRAIFAQSNRLPTLLSMLEQGHVKVSAISPSEQEQLLRSMNGEDQDKAKRMFARVDTHVEDRVADYLSALDGQPDRENGKHVFEKHCANCHRVGKAGYKVGPDLGTIAAKPDASVLADILDPNSRIDPEFRSYTVVTRDGRSFTGLLASESATNVILKKEKAQTDSILRRDIDEIQASDVSFMPANFHENVKPDDVADMLAYLRATLREK